MPQPPPEELVYLREFLALETHWCRLTGGPIDRMGMLVKVPKNELNICIPHIAERPVLGGIFDPVSSQMEPVIKKLRYVRNPVNRTQFDFVR